MGEDDLFAPALPGAQPQPALLAVELAPHHDVDHARHGVGAVEGRGAVQQDVHPLHGGGRNGRGVGEGPARTRSRQTPAVDQGQGRTDAQASQIDPRGQGAVAAGGVRETQNRSRRPRAGVVLREIRQHLRHGPPTSPVQGVAVQNHDRRRQRSGSPQQAAGDDHLLKPGDLVGRVVGRAKKDHPRSGLPPDQTRADQESIKRGRGRIGAVQPCGSPSRHEIAGKQDLLVGLGREQVEGVAKRAGGNIEDARLLGAGGRAGGEQAGRKRTGGHETQTIHLRTPHNAHGV
ncbi:hypothetical protein D3C86_1093490 [compost metagenome]